MLVPYVIVLPLRSRITLSSCMLKQVPGEDRSASSLYAPEVLSTPHSFSKCSSGCRNETPIACNLSKSSSIIGGQKLRGLKIATRKISIAKTIVKRMLSRVLPSREPKAPGFIIGKSDDHASKLGAAYTKFPQ